MIYEFTFFPVTFIFYAMAQCTFILRDDDKIDRKMIKLKHLHPEWSVLGPVPEEAVEPLCLVQSKLSVLSCLHPQRSVSKVQFA